MPPSHRLIFSFDDLELANY